MPPSTGYASASTQAAPSSGLSDFSLLIDLSDLPAAWWNAITDADFTKGQAWTGDGATRLPVDWIDPVDNADGTGNGFARIKYTPTLTGTGQTVRIYPPDSGNSAEAAGGTFGQHAAYDANWEAYWPLHDVNDRTSNARHLTARGGVTSGATGKLGDCYSFDGSDDSLDSAFDVDQFPTTVIAWANPSNTSDTGTVVAIDESTNNVDNMWLLANGAGGDQCRWAMREGSAFREALTSNTYTASNWHHFVGRETAVSERAAILNGDIANKGTNTTSDSVSDLDIVSIGRTADTTPSNEFTGLIDSVQIHSASRSDDWIAHEYEQSDDNAAFWGAWGWTAASGGVTGDAAQDSPAATTDATGTVPVTGDAAQDAPGATTDATGTLESIPISGDAAQVAPAATQDAAGSVPVTGDAAQDSPAATTDATGTLEAISITGDAAQDSPAATTDATGTVAISGDLTQDAPAGTTDATGTLEAGGVTGDAAQDAAPATQAMAGSVLISGALAQASPAATQQAIGEGVIERVAVDVLGAMSGDIVLGSAHSAIIVGEF